MCSAWETVYSVGELKAGGGLLFLVAAFLGLIFAALAFGNWLTSQPFLIYIVGTFVALWAAVLIYNQTDRRFTKMQQALASPDRTVTISGTITGISSALLSRSNNEPAFIFVDGERFMIPSQETKLESLCMAGCIVKRDEQVRVTVHESYEKRRRTPVLLQVETCSQTKL